MPWHPWILAVALAGVLSACQGGGGGEGNDGGGEDGGAIDPAAYTATVNTAMARADHRLACFQGHGEPECGLRLYQVMVESFVDGDSSADYLTGYGTSPHRGDLQGVLNSLDVIQSTGVNALWLTPIFRSVPVSGQDDWTNRLDATGYFASDYFHVDPHFGSNAKLQELVDAAHARGLYVFLDGVFGHFKRNARDYPSPRGRTLSATGLARYPEDLAFFQEVATYWVTEYKIDGWRLDQAYQVPVEYWDDLRTAVASAASGVSYTNAAGQTVHPLGYMVGEIWKGASEIASQGYGPAASPALLSAFDFPLRYSLVQTLAIEESGSGRRAATHLQSGYASHLAYPAHARPNLMLTNHDLVRFGDLLQRGALAEPGDGAYWARHKAAFSFLASYSGPITLYYGDEVGQELVGFAARQDTATCALRGVCDDHVSRTTALVEGVPPTVGAAATVLTPAQADLKHHVAALMVLRDAHPALANGSRTHIYSDSHVYLDRKDKGSDHILYVLNTQAAPAVLTVQGTAIGGAGQLVSLLEEASLAPADGQYTLPLKPFEGRFFVIATPTAEGPQTGAGSSLSGQGPLADCSAPTVVGLGPLGKELMVSQCP